MQPVHLLCTTYRDLRGCRPDPLRPFAGAAGSQRRGINPEAAMRTRAHDQADRDAGNSALVWVQPGERR